MFHKYTTQNFSVLVLLTKIVVEGCWEARESTWRLWDHRAITIFIFQVRKHQRAYRGPCIVLVVFTNIISFNHHIRYGKYYCSFFPHGNKLGLRRYWSSCEKVAKLRFEPNSSDSKMTLSFFHSAFVLLSSLSPISWGVLGFRQFGDRLIPVLGHGFLCHCHKRGENIIETYASGLLIWQNCYLKDCDRINATLTILNKHRVGLPILPSFILFLLKSAGLYTQKELLDL